MESPISSKNIVLKEMKPQVCFIERSTPLRSSTGFGKDNLSSSCNCEKLNKKDAPWKGEKEFTEEFASKNNGEPNHSTPLRVGCCRRRSSLCIESCCRSNGSLKTPVTNTRKTPLRLPVNPFDAVLLDRLHLPICSPSIFTQIVNTDDDEFKWNIEQQATLFPAPIEEEFQGHHHAYEHFDPETESKLQAAIDRFYESKLIAPSPWTGTKNAFCKGSSTFSTKVADNAFLRAGKSGPFPCLETKGSPVTRDVCTQTQITLPSHLPPELDSILQKYKLPTPSKEESCSASSVSAMESESFSSSTLRRKLFFHMEEMSISQPPSPYAIETPSSPTHDKSLLPQAFSSPIKFGATLPDFHHSSETDEEEDHPDFLESSQTTFWKDMSSPSLSPIAKNPASKTSEDLKVQKIPISEELNNQFTPPSSRAKHKPIFPFNFAPLLENEEDNEFKEGTRMVTSDEQRVSKMQNIERCASEKLSQNSDSCKNSSQKGEKMSGDQETFPSAIHAYSRAEGLSYQKSNLILVSDQHQMLSHDRVHSMEVSDCGTSRMQDTGYQTVSMTTLPSSMSLNSSKIRNGLVLPTDAATLAGKGSLPSRICEDGYMSLTSIKLPLVPEYDDESMCDLWHTSPSPIASSTPAKNITGLLM